MPLRLRNSLARLAAAAQARRRIIAAAASAAAVLLLAAGAAVQIAVMSMRPTAIPPDHPVIAAGHALLPVGFSELPGWAEDEPAAAFGAFLRSCEPLSRREGHPLAAACADAMAVAGDVNDGAARAFFETAFQPFRIELADGEGLLTAYYEPVIAGSRTRSAEFNVPLRGLPRGHVVVNDANRPESFSAELTAARETENGLAPLPTRGEIDDGAIDGLAEPLVWIADPVDAFYAHIQGSTRVRLRDGELVRLGFAGRNGHAYASVGQAMMEKGIRPPGGFSMDGMRAFFAEEPELARELMHLNPSYIFFREIEGLAPELGPIGAQGVALTEMRSIAVDPDFHALGTPMFIDAALPTGRERALEGFSRLMIAQDTGSAIKGAARGDLFFGTGAEAGSMAGGIKRPGTFYILLPREG